MKKTVLLAFVLSITITSVFAQRNITLASPDKKLEVTISIGDKISYQLSHESDLLIDKSALSMTFTNGNVWGINPRYRKSTTKSINEEIASPFSISKTVQNQCNELTIWLRGDWGLKFRAYNDGMAYRFFHEANEPLTVKNELVQFNFPADYTAYIPYIRNHRGGLEETFEQQYQRSFESLYDYLSVSEMDKSRLMFLPIVLEAGNGKKISITEVDLESYPGLFLNKAEGNTLESVFAPIPKKTEQGGHNNIQQVVREREDFIARVSGKREFPWRVAIVAEDDTQLAVSDMTYRLAAPSRVEDTSWIKPGKVAWEWWHDWNIHGVDFEAGINNDTYKYYIDFASENGIEYIILDEGWSIKGMADLMQVAPEIDLSELIEYGKNKNVGIILWAGYWAFDRDLENICKHYSEMGIKGFKVDFMNRDDQEMVDFIYRASEIAAKYELVLNYHGMYKPAGLQRTFPNILNFEGVFGLEQLKVRDIDMVRNDVIVPFTRMIAGPVDYTQGAMKNASKENFRYIFSEPMSQGTRCRQLALYVIYESPLNMLCDSPTDYMKETESLDFISRVPTVWDESIALNGKIGEYVTIARRLGEEWYVGGITSWDARDTKLDLSFLPAGNYKMTLYKDGPNAHRKGIDYRLESTTVNSGETVDIHMAPGGGFAVRLEKI